MRPKPRLIAYPINLANRKKHVFCFFCFFPFFFCLFSFFWVFFGGFLCFSCLGAHMHCCPSPHLAFSLVFGIFMTHLFCRHEQFGQAHQVTPTPRG